MGGCLHRNHVFHVILSDIHDQRLEIFTPWLYRNDLSGRRSDGKCEVSDISANVHDDREERLSGVNSLHILQIAEVCLERSVSG